MPIVSVHNLSKDFFGKKVLHAINLSLYGGKIYGMIGPNGAGKTTLMKTILGYLTYKGEILIAPNVSISYVPENIVFYDYLTGEQAINLFADIHGYHKDNYKDRFIEYAKILKYQDEKKFIKEHSKGNLRKLMLLQALVAPCNLLLLDEPFSGLDPLAIERLIQLFHSNIQEERTILINTHLFEYAKILCDELFFIEHGQIIKQTTKDNFSDIDLAEIFD